MATWDFEAIKEQLAKSDLWVARAIYRLSKDFTSIDITNLDRGIASTDNLFFDSLREEFEKNGYFTDRHIFLARRKIRDPYIQYLVMLANT